MTKLNKNWHLKNKIPKNPTLEERIKWHEEHAKHCNCRDSRLMLVKLKAKMEIKRSEN